MGLKSSDFTAKDTSLRESMSFERFTAVGERQKVT